ncbi:hypothetical protein OH77DRAFT_1075509 [Trametes cingulata]|nr:hypothetical protein OH77DRAFT_1075509 [Trametes cingulata]
MTCEPPFMMLDEDCLEEIFKLLRPERGLRSLSLTSKWMRSRCKRILFERSFGHAHDIDMPDRLPPPTVWPYIRQYLDRGLTQPLPCLLTASAAHRAGGHLLLKSDVIAQVSRTARVL